MSVTVLANLPEILDVISNSLGEVLATSDILKSIASGSFSTTEAKQYLNRLNCFQFDDSISCPSVRESLFSVERCFLLSRSDRYILKRSDIPQNALFDDKSTKFHYLSNPKS